MTGYEQEHKDIEKLTRSLTQIESKIKNEYREPTREESQLMAEIKGAIEGIKDNLPQKPKTLQNGPLGGGDTAPAPMAARSVGTGPLALKSPGESKKYSDLFGSKSKQWKDTSTNFFNAVLSGRHHPDLIKNSMTETVPSSGGFLVPVEYSERIHNVALEDELVMPRCFVQPMTSNEQKIPAMEVGDHSTALMGGFIATYKAELGTLSENNPKTRGMTLTANKLTGLIRMSNELAQDTPGGENQIIQLCGKGLGWYRDKAFLKGSGAGEPLGIQNADCTIEVDPESGQDSGTIVYENLVKMMGRIFAGSFGNSIWIAHQTCVPQLLQLSIAIGTSGSYIPVMSEGRDGQFRILTRPVIFTEKTETLGTKGDIMLADLSQYVVGLRSGMRFDTSIHPGFTTDELYARLIERHCGQPLWDKSLTLEDGSTTVSPFVVLGERG